MEKLIRGCKKKLIKGGKIDKRSKQIWKGKRKDKKKMENDKENNKETSMKIIKEYNKKE